MDLRRFNLLARIQSWKTNIADAVEALQREHSSIRREMQEMHGALSAALTSQDGGFRHAVEDLRGEAGKARESSENAINSLLVQLQNAKEDSVRRDAINAAFQALFGKHESAIAEIETLLSSLQEKLDERESNALGEIRREVALEAEARHEMGLAFVETIAQFEILKQSHGQIRADLLEFKTLWLDADQRSQQTAGTLGALQSRTEENAGAIAKLETTLAGLISAHAELGEQVVEAMSARQAVSDLQERFGRLESLSSIVGMDDIVEIEARQAELAAAVGVLGERLEQADTAAADRLQETTARLQQAEALTDALDAKLAEVQQAAQALQAASANHDEVGEAEARLKSYVEQEAGGVQARQAELAAAVGVLGERLEQADTAAADRLRETTARLQQAEAWANALDAKLAEVQQAAQALQAASANHDEVGEAEARLKSYVEQEAGGVQARQAELAAAVGALGERLEQADTAAADRLRETTARLQQAEALTDALDAKLAEVQQAAQALQAAHALHDAEGHRKTEEIVRLSDIVVRLQARLDGLEQDLKGKSDGHAWKLEGMMREGSQLFRAMAFNLGPVGRVVAQAPHLYINGRGDDAIIVASLTPEPSFRNGDVEALVGRIASGAVENLYVTAHPPAAGAAKLEPAVELLPLFQDMPQLAQTLFETVGGQAPGERSAEEVYDQAIGVLSNNPYLIDTVVCAYEASVGSAAVPFDKPADLPATVAPKPKRQSVVFLHNNYYHFNMLAKALRKRGWDAMTVSLESPESPQRQFYYGEDVNLFDSDYGAMREKVRAFFRSAPERFGALHFYGNGHASFFPDNYESTGSPVRTPWDFFELRRHRVVIGYMPSGCLDGAKQSEIRRFSGGLCGHCVWENQPLVCSDARAAAWADRLEATCDWIGVEGDWVVGRRTGARYVRGPIVTALDPEAWSPDIATPQEMWIPRSEGEILVYHAVGNYETRRRAGRDIKGTKAVLDATKKLQGEGLPVRLIFFSDVPSTEIKNYQVQADIIVDQLRYGRYGATAREGMMLGKPVVGAVDPRQEGTEAIHPMFQECPIVRADVGNIADVLRGLVTDRLARERAGRASRDYAVRWHGDEACAERYESVIARIRAGLTPDSPELYPRRLANEAEQGQDDAGQPRSHRAVLTRLPSDRTAKDWAGGN